MFWVHFRAFQRCMVGAAVGVFDLRTGLLDLITDRQRNEHIAGQPVGRIDH